MQYLIEFYSQPEAASYVMSGLVLDAAGVKVRIKLGNSMSNRSRDIRLPQMSDERRRTPAIT